MLSGVAVDSAKYCTAGVDADAVISVVKGPSEVGVAGTGSFCQSSSSGRPTWLVFNWIESAVGLSGSVDELVTQYRHLVIHELFHALGFSNSMFVNARDENGQHKNLLKLLKVTDTDGAQDEIWHFVKGRAHEMGQIYFGCSNGSSWHGVPLMGLPDYGRASHWETRVLRDDVMSYGLRSTISSLSLAAMEDLGFYLANYSAAGCMSWGYKQGCEFVTSRCGTTSNDQSARPSSSSECNGDPAWASTRAPSSAYLSEKCEGGITPCATLSSSGFSSASGVLKCNAQCYTNIATRSDCSAGPTTALTSAGLDTTCATIGPFGEQCIPEHYLQWVILGVAALGALLALFFCRTFCCPRAGSTSLLNSLSISTMTLASAMSSVATYCLVVSSMPEHKGALQGMVVAYVGTTSLWVIVGVSLFILISCVLSIIGVCFKVTWLLLVNLIVYTFVLIAQVAVTAIACYWISLVDTVTSDTLAALRGTSAGLHSGRFGAELLQEAEGVTCRVYQTCCRDPALDLMLGADSSARVCRVSHEGSATAIVTALDDPSSPSFCPYVTGARLVIQPAQGVCDLLDFAMQDFSQSQCQEDFCTTGVDGYFSFVQSFVSFLQTNAYIIGSVFALIALLQLMFLVNLWNVRRRFLRQRKSHQQIQPFSSTEPMARHKPPALRPTSG